jgi:hypothetical protein
MHKISPQKKDLHIEDYIVNTADYSLGNEIAYLAMKEGLMKIHTYMDLVGLEEKAIFIGAPDFSITLNSNRFLNGFSIGGKLKWGNGEVEFIPVDLMINSCGVLSGFIENLPSKQSILEKIRKLQSSKPVLNGIDITWDFGHKNHFIALFESITSNKFVFMIHSSAPEFKRDNCKGFGLYPTESKILKAKIKNLTTSYGNLKYLDGNDADTFYQQYCLSEQFSKDRREYVASELFGDFELISNVTHLGLTDMNTCLLGCYEFESENEVYPFLTTPSSNSYLVKGHRNIDLDLLNKFNIAHKANELGYENEIVNANIIPHGLGLDINIGLNSAIVTKNFENGYEIKDRDSNYSLLFDDINNLEHKYNSNNVLKRAIDLKMCSVIDEMRPIYQFKI